MTGRTMCCGVSGTPWTRLVSSPFGGTVYPVSDKRASVLGIKAYQRVADIPELVDLAVVVTPAATVPEIIGECVKEGVGEPNSRLHSGRNPCSSPPSLDASVLFRNFFC